MSEFAMILDDSKLPHDGLSPLGLGQWQQTVESEFEEFELARSRCGVRHLDDFERRGLLIGRLDDLDTQALADLEVVEAANREIRGHNVSFVFDDDLEEDGTDRWSSVSSASDKPAVSATPLYSTAEDGASRDGKHGGFNEIDDEEEARRKLRALSEKSATETRKAEKRRCAGCKRYACIC